MVAGVDEAGRGALAGPVVAAAVILRPDASLPGVNDSKKLSPSARQMLYNSILERSLAVSVHWVGPRRIDEINILVATHEAMQGALRALPIVPDIALVDGLPVPNLPCRSRAIVHGDALEYSIAAASIVAKVSRDGLMSLYGNLCPLYGFRQHKGYGTSAHRAAIRAHGPCAIHRRTFLGHVGLSLDSAE
jgi:ribonuclease HII